MVLGDPEIKVTPPRGANLDATGALGGDYRGGALDKGYSILGTILQ